MSDPKVRSIETVRQQLVHTERERDAWKGKSAHHFEMASHRVEALRKELAELEASSKGSGSAP